MSFNVDIFLSGSEHDSRDHSGVLNVATYQIGFGGDMTTTGTFYGPATLFPGPFAGPPGTTPAVDHPIPIVGALTTVGWTVSATGADLQVYLNGAPVGAPITLSSLSGFAPFGPVPVAGGDVVSLEYAANAAPGNGSVVFFIEG